MTAGPVVLLWDIFGTFDNLFDIDHATIGLVQREKSEVKVLATSEPGD